MENITIVTARHRYPEKSGFAIDRPFGFEGLYVFVHFLTPVVMTLSGAEIQIYPGDCILYDKSFCQKWYTEVPLVHDWIHIDGDVVAVADKYGILSNHVYRLRDSAFVTQIVNEIEVEHFRDSKFKSELCANKLEELFIGIARNDESATDVESSRRREFENLRFSVFSDLSHSWTIEEMAAKVSMSSSRFFTVYKEVFGLSPLNDLIQARIHAAKMYLIDGGYSVNEVSEMLGYSNKYHFIRQFRKVTGVSPGKYAKSHI